MPDTKITALAAITTVAPAADLFPIVDVSDNSMAASGTTKNITVNQLLGAGGTATLASATITGDLTVDTSTLKVDSTNNRVGINNASPAAALDILGGKDSTNVIVGAPLSTVGGGAFANYSELLFKNTSGSNSDACIRSYGNVWNAAGSQLAFFTANNSAVAERYRIDNTGVATWSNVGGTSGTAMTLNSTGLGVGGLPSGGMLMTVGSTSSVSATANAYQILSNKGVFNITCDGSTNAAGTTIAYSWANGGQGPLIFRNAAISNVLTLDASGNVGIGVTPSAWGGSNRAALQFPGGNAIQGSAAIGLASFNNCFNNGTNDICIANGTTYKHVVGTGYQWFIGTGTAGNSFSFGDAKMTLDASGRLLVNNSSSGDFKFEVSGTNVTSSYSAKFSGGSSTSNGVNFYLPGTRSSDTTYYLQRYGDDVAVRFQIFGNGNVQNTTGTYGTISDLRLKENILDARNYLADLLKLRVVKYSLKADASPTANLLGLIAQEVEQVFPTLVETSGDDVKSVKTTVLIPMLLKAIQELTARVQTLEAK